MEKKLRKGMLKKFVVIICVFTLLQSYLMSFAYVVKAMDLTFSGEIDLVTNEVTEEMPSANGNISNETEISEEITENIESDDVNSETSVEISEDVLEEDTSKETPNDEDDQITNEEQSVQNPEQSNQSQEVETPNEKTEEENEILEEPIIEGNIDIQEQDGIIEEYVEPSIGIEVLSENSSIYKGYLYANATSDLRYETVYTTIDKLTFVGAKNITSATIQDDPDKISLITNTKLGLLNDMYYKQTRISIEEFNNIVGEDGFIALYDANNILIGKITKYTIVENGYYVFKYSSQMNSIKFEFVNLVGDGQISIINDKAIKQSTVYSRNQISLFSAINTIANAQMTVGEQIQNIQVEGNINLEETESKMTIGIDNDALSVEGENEIAINITLNTNEERYDLFENPSIDLEFPSAIDKVDITGINLLYKNGLSLDSWNVYTNSLGKEVLKINLAGSQLEYTPGTVQEGTTLIIYANLDVNRLTSNTTENLKMTYTNKDTIRKSYMLEGKDSEDITLSFVGKQEMVRAIKGIDTVDAEEKTTYDEDVQKIQVNAESTEQQTVTLTGTILNNFETTTEDVYIIGRIPFKGNKDGNGNELGSTFDTTLSSVITTTGLVADIYYSENPEAKFDDKSWTQDTTDVSKYKSYKIVIRDGKIAKGERLTFEYNVLTPANIGYNAKSYSTYTVYYSLDGQQYFGNCSFGVVTEEKELTTDDLEENQKEEVATLTVGTQITQGGTELENGDSVYERQILRYKIIVTNNSNVSATNVKIKACAENSNIYYLKTWIIDEYQGIQNYETADWIEDTEGVKLEEEFSIESLAPGESRTFEFQAIVNKDATETFGKIKVIGDNVPETDIETLRIPVEKAKLEIKLDYAGTEDLKQNDALTGGEMKVYTYVKNISDTNLENVKVSFVLPEELKFEEDYFTYGADDLQFEINKTLNETIVTFTIPKLSANSEREIYISTLIKDLPLDVKENNIAVKSYAMVDEEKYLSNDYIKLSKQGKTQIQYEWKADLQKETLENGDEITFTLNVTNTGVVFAGEVQLSDDIPSGLELISATLQKGETILEENVMFNEKNIKAYSLLNAGETMTLTMKFKVNEELYERDQATIDNKVKITGGAIEDYDTEVISYKINNKNVTVNTEEIKPDDNNNNNDNLTNNDNNQDGNNSGNSNNNDQSNSNNPNEEQQPQVPTPEVPSQDSEPIVKMTYNISGKVWLDKNKDGINNSEDGMKAIVAILYKANSQGGADISNQVATTVTDSIGNYKFENLEAGNYVVAFNYDSSLYNVTKYQVKTATLSQNSDAISKTITSGDSKFILAMTDVITIESSSLIDIDMGLVSKNDFDLSLDKYISKVTVKNNAGTKNYVYENKDDIKLEIHSKNYKSSELEITYKIVIKNDGDIAGYVNKLVDYIPEGTTIDINVNEGWYHGDDGNLYYNGLIGKSIEPGKTKEVTLKLKRSLANGETAIIVNSAEISEYTNNLGFQDIDSVANNKMEKEDDYGKTTLTVTISTGVITQNIVSIIIIIISIVAIIFIAQNKMQKKIYK